MGRVRAGFLHTQTQPPGQDPRPEPSPFTKRIFFRGPDQPPSGSAGPVKPNQKGSFFETSPKLNIKPTTKQPIPKIPSFQISTATPKY